MYKLSSTEREKNNNIEALAVCPFKNGLLLIFMKRGMPLNGFIAIIIVISFKYCVKEYMTRLYLEKVGNYP